MVHIAAYIWLVGAVQSFKGDLVTKDFEMGAVVRQETAPLIAHYVVFDA